MAWYDEDENPWDVWLSQHFPGIFAHPNSPAGGTGYGSSRKPGVLECDPSPWNVPHPNSPAGRYITPTEAASEYLTFEFEKARARVRASSTWDGLRSAAERALGPQSFGLGACYGFVKNPAMSVGELIQLQRIFIEADLYDQLTRQSPWWKRALFGTMMANPGGMFLTVALVRAGKISPDDLKRSYEMREALIKEVGHIFAHPGDFFANLKDEIKASYLDKWNRFTVLHAKTDLKSQFEAGEIFGDVLMDVVMVILTVVSGVGAARQAAAQATKLAAKVPQLVRVAEYFRGLRTAKAGALVEEGVGAAKGANTASKTKPMVEVERPRKSPAFNKPPPVYKAGCSEDQILSTPKRLRPPPETYLEQSYIDQHLGTFKKEGGGFVFTEADIADPKYQSFNPNKFVMAQSDLDGTIADYKATGDLRRLENSLGYEPGSLEGKKLYMMHVDDPKVVVPSGNEGGANALWKPGGYNHPGGMKEAVLDNIPINHGNDIGKLLVNGNVRPLP